MASSFSAVFHLTAKDVSLSSNIDKANAKVRTLKDSLNSAGSQFAGVVGKLYNTAASGASWLWGAMMDAMYKAKEISILSKRMGMPVGEVAKLSRYAETLGLNIGSMARSMMLLSKWSYSALNGSSKAAVELSENLGLTHNQLLKISKGGLNGILEMKVAMEASNKSLSQQEEIFSKLFGRRWPELKPMLMKTSKEIKDDMSGIYSFNDTTVEALLRIQKLYSRFMNDVSVGAGSLASALEGWIGMLIVWISMAGKALAGALQKVQGSSGYFKFMNAEQEAAHRAEVARAVRQNAPTKSELRAKGYDEEKIKGMVTRGEGMAHEPITPEMLKASKEIAAYDVDAQMIVDFYNEMESLAKFGADVRSGKIMAKDKAAKQRAASTIAAGGDMLTPDEIEAGNRQSAVYAKFLETSTNKSMTAQQKLNEALLERNDIENELYVAKAKHPKMFGYTAEGQIALQKQAENEKQIADLEKTIAEEKMSREEKVSKHIFSLNDLVHQQRIKMMKLEGASSKEIRDAEIQNALSIYNEKLKIYENMKNNKYASAEDVMSAQLEMAQAGATAINLQSQSFSNTAKGDSMRSMGGGGRVAPQALSSLAYSKTTAQYTKMSYEVLVQMRDNAYKQGTGVFISDAPTP